MQTRTLALLLMVVIARAAPPPASVRVPVEVPASMRHGVFATNRTLLVPPGFRISVVARVAGARFLAIAPNGDIFVSQPNAGKVLAVRERPGADPLVFEFASGLRLPHDIVFHPVKGVMHVYIAESDKIRRTVYWHGDTSARALEVVVGNLPDASTPELNGPHAHALKNIAFDRNDKLYVSSASTCNACVSDLWSNPIRGAVYQYNADGTGQRLFAKGVRNAEGVAILPGTDELWVVINGRDEIRYPIGDGTGNYGQVIRAYVDNHPPEIFTRLRDGGNYGWPTCNPTQDGPSGYDDMLLETDVEVDPKRTVDCISLDRPTRGIQAHSAPLGLSFLHNSAFPAPYRFGAVVALHGSWNRTQPTGYKLVFFPWNAAAQRPESPVDLVSGWLDTTVWGRPVDAVPDANGGLIISDDSSGTIYRLSATPSQACSFNILSTGAEFDAAGGAGSLGLSATEASCSWTAASSVSWLQVYPLSGAGTATVSYNVFPNFSSLPRTAMVQVGGRTISVTQAAAQGTANERFVGQMYFNFFGRRASPDEIQIHASSLNTGVSRAGLAQQFMSTEEFNLGGRFIAGLYVGLLERDAEFSGWLFQRTAMTAGATNPLQIATNFLDSTEFNSKFGVLSDMQFASLMYRNILLRPASSDEIALQVRALREGLPRAAVAAAFLNSGEFRGSAGPRLTAFLLYATLLLRDPSFQQRNAAIAQLTAGADIQSMIDSLIRSVEFANALK